MCVFQYFQFFNIHFKSSLGFLSSRKVALKWMMEAKCKEEKEKAK